jgi:hypothetical protein
MGDTSPNPKRVAIIQSSYIPWKGYFDIINSVDEFIFLDDVQFTKRDWRSRNKIKTPQGLAWLTIPVITRGLFHQSIDSTVIAEAWARKHWMSLRSNYAKAAYFEEVGSVIKGLYDEVADEKLLSKVNRRLISGICSILGISTRFSLSGSYASTATKTDRLLLLCQAAAATHYLSGPAAAAYMETDKFTAAGISVSYADYSGYPEYKQLHGPFEHGVTILDLLFNTGPNARSYMKSFAA